MGWKDGLTERAIKMGRWVTIKNRKVYIEDGETPTQAIERSKRESIMKKKGTDGGSKESSTPVYVDNVSRGVHQIKIGEESKLTYTYAKNGIYVSDLTVHSDHRNSGIGTKLLSEIKKLADEKNMSVSLYSMPATSKMSEQQLRDWYKKRGFTQKVSKSPNDLEYLPKSRNK